MCLCRTRRLHKPLFSAQSSGSERTPSCRFSELLHFHQAEEDSGCTQKVAVSVACSVVHKRNGEDVPTRGLLVEGQAMTCPARLVLLR